MAFEHSHEWTVTIRKREERDTAWQDQTAKASSRQVSSWGTSRGTTDRRSSRLCDEAGDAAPAKASRSLPPQGWCPVYLLPAFSHSSGVKALKTLSSLEDPDQTVQPHHTLPAPSPQCLPSTVHHLTSHCPHLVTHARLSALHWTTSLTTVNILQTYDKIPQQPYRAHLFISHSHDPMTLIIRNFMYISYNSYALNKRLCIPNIKMRKLRLREGSITSGLGTGWARLEPISQGQNKACALLPTPPPQWASSEQGMLPHPYCLPQSQMSGMGTPGHPW